MKELCIWGAGEIGKRFFKHLSDKWSVVFVDTNEKVIDSDCCGRKVISLDKYLEKYSDIFILVAHLHEEESIKILEYNKIINYFIHCDCPGEFKEPYVRNNLKQYVVEYLKDREDYVLYGLNLYSILIDEWVSKQYGIHPYILANNISSDFIRKIRQSYDELKIIDNISNLTDIKEICVCTDNYSKLEECLIQKYKLTDIFDCSKKIKCYYNPRIEKFHNLYRGSRCFIVATGPSLTTRDLELLRIKKEICISMNTIFYAFDKTKWRPNYYVMDDYRGIEEYKDIIDTIEFGVKFLGDTSEMFWKEAHGKDIYCFHKSYEYYINRLPKFSDDFSKGIYAGGAVTYTCMQLAVYMGFKEICLLGVDFTYSDDESKPYLHFHKEDNLAATGYAKQVKLAYIAAEKYTREHGIKIYNATRGGKLEIFERVNLDKYLE